MDGDYVPIVIVFQRTEEVGAIERIWAEFTGNIIVTST